MNAQSIIIVLEDERPQLMLLQAALREAGKVVGFSDPEAALDYLKNQSVDAALIDIGLGVEAKMDGLEFIRAVRKFDADLCIIIRTGHDTSDVADQAIELGAFRRSIKTKQNLDDLRSLTKTAIEETRTRRRISRDAATSAEMRDELRDVLGTMDEEQSAGDTYRVFFQSLRNRVTSVAGMAELLVRQATTSQSKQIALQNRDLVASLVDELGRFVDSPLNRAQIGPDPTTATANEVIEAIRRRFAVSVESVRDAKTLKVCGLNQDLFVAAPGLRLVAALRHIIEFCWARSEGGSTTHLNAWCSDRLQEELDGMREHKEVFTRFRSHLPSLTVGFRISCGFVDTSIAQIRRAMEDYSGNPRNGCLHTVATFIDVTRSVLVVYHRPTGCTVFELHVPVGSA